MLVIGWILWLFIGGGVCFYVADKKIGNIICPLFMFITVFLYAGVMWLSLDPPVGVKSVTIHEIEEIKCDNGTNYQRLKGLKWNLTRYFGVTFPEDSKFQLTVYEDSWHGIPVTKSPNLELVK